ncbi:methyl methanesulfonate-sensitivity protein 22 [Rhodotorula toruloides]|uniref:Methyl methanesulfonate-sensitivity protein 22 n=1 Tax=Rhodotorula toruloides TaxID=5286 RepID=A0A511KQ80_RHOTO|nr:methyl methanesulfonate-sensitivity protein 22 [Rhodotorula toruloides]
MAKPSKSVHHRAGSGDRHALEQDILNLPSPLRLRSDGESELPSEDEDDEEEEGDGEEESQSPGRQLGPSRLELSYKRKRALGAMMPAVFLKKAAKDLKLMAREREVGEYSSGSELNSGDEEAVERERNNRAKKRIVPGHAPMRFEGEAFTDESGDGLDRSDDGLGEQDEEEENDAVSSWLQAFAPRRTNAADEDIVDRFLKRAKRPPPKKRKTGKSTGPRARPVDDGSTKERTKDQRAAPKESGNYVVGSHALDGPAAQRKKRKPRSVPLDTDDAIFAFVRQQEPALGAYDDDDDVVVAAPLAKPRSVADPLPTSRNGDPFNSTLAVQAVDARPDEAWATFGKFSPDFGLERLPPGIRFASPSSFVANGHLYSLVTPAETEGFFSCDVYGLHLSPSTSLEQLESHLPAICDDILEDFARLAKEAEGPDPLVDAGKILQYLGKRIAAAGAGEAARIGLAVLASLERLEDRLNTSPVFQAIGKDFRRGRILVGWYLVDITARVQRMSSDVSDERRIQQHVRSLVQHLLRHGQDRTVKTLKAASGGDRVVADASVEAWLGLISLSLNPDSFGQSALTIDVLWRIVEEEVRAGLSLAARKGPASGEILAYTTLMLCAISQFSPSGVSTSTPRLPAHWPGVVAILDVIQPSALAAPDYNLSSTAVARRDRYLWTLFARCLVFAERWGWRVDVKDDLLPRLFDLLNARRLSDLATETIGDFPDFLQDLSKFGDIRLDRPNDTAFAIFLKLVIAAAQALPATSDDEERRRGAQLTRLFLRLSPMVSASWSRQAVELTRSGSILVNHYSLHLAFGMLNPSGASQRVEHVRRLVSFGDVDEEARRTCIRAVLYFAAAFRHHDLPLKPIVDWLASIADTLKAEYTEIERQRRKEEFRVSKDRSRSASGKGDPLWQRAVLLTMILRSVQVILRFKKAGDAAPTYPDVALLHPSWTSHLLDSPLALDPMIGREAIKVIDCFLDVRRAALPRKKNAAQVANDAGQEESQDDFGTFDDLDFDDPTLNAMLGIEGEGAGAGAGGDDALRSADKACAELLKTTVTPAFFRLVSNIFVGSTGSGPSIVDRVSYAQYAVECWVRCAAIAVENGVADWRPYLQYGAQSWKRLSDPVGRRDIGLFLIIEILKHDPAAYTVFTEDVLEIWFESIVARRLTSQNLLTETLLNVEVENVSTVSPLVEGAPFDRSASSGRIEVEQLDLLDRRPELLKFVFENAARLATTSTALTVPPSTAQLLHRSDAAPIRPTPPRGTIMNLLRSMLASLRDNLAAIHDETTRRNYSTFVRSTVAALTAAGTVKPSGLLPGKRGPFNETTLPDVALLRSSTSA